MTEETHIGVMLVDDHPLALSGLRNFLSSFPDLALVGEASNGRLAVRRYLDVRPDVVLMDLLMPEMDGVAATQAIRAIDPFARIVALSSASDAAWVQQALQAGAVGYLLKDVSAFELAQAIRAAASGSVALAPAALQALQALGGEHCAVVPLSEREREVLALLAQGHSNQQIADALHLSRPTIKYHLANIFSKLGVTSRTAAIAAAYQREMISVSG